MTEETQEDGVLEAVAEMYASEAEAMTKYIETSYAKKVKPPLPPTDKELSFVALAGFETVSFAIPAIAMALFSAIRTGQFFYILEMLMLAKYGLIEGIPAVGLSILVMLLSLFGFEGYILARGIKNGRKKVQQLGDDVEVKANGLATALAFMVILSIAMFSATELIDNLSEVFLRNSNIYMIAITGVGATVLVYFGGDDIGIAGESYRIKKDKLLKYHSDKYNEWWQGAVRSWISVKATKTKKEKTNTTTNNTPTPAPVTTGSSDWRSVKLELSPEQMYELAKMDLSDKTNKDRLAQSFNVVTKTIENWNGQAIKVVEDWEMISNHISKTGKFPSRDEMKAMGLSGKNVSLYILHNSESLLGNNLIPETYIKTAQETLGK